VSLYRVSHKMIHDAEMQRVRLLRRHMHGPDNPELDELTDALCAAQNGRVTGKQFGTIQRAAAAYSAHRDRVNGSQTVVLR